MSVYNAIIVLVLPRVQDIGVFWRFVHYLFLFKMVDMPINNGIRSIIIKPSNGCMCASLHVFSFFCFCNG